MLRSKHKKNKVYPCRSKFYYIKVGCDGGQKEIVQYMYVCSCKEQFIFYPEHFNEYISILEVLRSQKHVFLVYMVFLKRNFHDIFHDCTLSAS